MARNIDIFNWAEQARKEAIGWAFATVDFSAEQNPAECPHGQPRMADFDAGYRAGWNDAVRVLKLHGVIKITD